MSTATAIAPSSNGRHFPKLETGGLTLCVVNDGAGVEWSDYNFLVVLDAKNVGAVLRFIETHHDGKRSTKSATLTFGDFIISTHFSGRGFTVYNATIEAGEEPLMQVDNADVHEVVEYLRTFLGTRASAIDTAAQAPGATMNYASPSTPAVSLPIELAIVDALFGATTWFAQREPKSGGVAGFSHGITNAFVFLLMVVGFFLVGPYYMTFKWLVSRGADRPTARVAAFIVQAFFVIVFLVLGKSDKHYNQ